MNAFEDKTKPAVVITDYDDRMRMLTEMRKAHTLRPIRFMREKDLFHKVFFAFEPHALYETSRFFETTPDVAEMYLDFLYYVDANEDYASKRLKTLQSLKKRLLTRNALAMEKDLDSWFKGQDILLKQPVFDPFVKDAIKRLDRDYTIVHDYDEPTKIPLKRTVVSTLEDEITDIALRMLELHEAGTPFESMALLNAHGAYEPIIRSIFPMLEIPYNLDRRHPLFAYAITQEFLGRLKKHDDEPPYEAFNAVLETLQEKTRDEADAKLVSEIVRAVNPLVRFQGTVRDLWSFIVHTLKRSVHRIPRYQNGVDLKNITDGGYDHYEHVFVVGMHEGYAPSYKEADDYLSEEEKAVIGHPTAQMVNQSKKAALLYALARFNDVHIYESKASIRETYQRATLIETLQVTHSFKEVEPLKTEKQPYSESLDLLQAKMAYDDYRLHDTKSAALEKLYPVFKDRITAHDPTFTGLKEETVERMLGDSFSVSTTQIDRYAECAFRFLLDDLLDIDPVDDPFNMDLGTFFHDVLEHTLHEKTVEKNVLEDALERTLEHSDKDYSEREIAFFKNAYPFIRRAHKVIRDQHASTHYAHEESEAKVSMAFDFGRHVTFKGKIDKVMRRGNNFFLIDYKTGDITLDLTLAPHGMKAQLLFYVLLYMANVEGASPVGFFEQTVYPKTPRRVLGKSKEEQYEEALKLKGYVIDDVDALEAIDRHYDDAPMIHGLNITKKGAFQKTVKRFKESDIDRLLKTLKYQLETMLKGISKGDFPINPKQDSKRKPISCKYCPFSDICYKRAEDFKTLDVKKDFHEVFESLKEED
ncbi:MAG: PD-(D/E)XK nuclease family protein [Bacillota bacterium]